MAKKSMIAAAEREPKFSTRQHNRCMRCGRPRAYYRKFGLCRVCFRELANKGELPGVEEGQLVRNDPGICLGRHFSHGLK